jgi:hypothetical protein
MTLRIGLVVIALLGAFTSLGLTSAPPFAIFDAPTAQAKLGEPITFSTTFHADSAPDRVELLLRLPDSEALTVLPAEVTQGSGTFAATATLEGHHAPNTTLVYQFRARHDACSCPDSFGPEAQVTVVDDRVEWRTLEGPTVRLHWYNGDEAFAQRALDIGEEAIANATSLLGVTNFPQVDFFIYDNETVFRQALGPGTRENVGGQAHSDIRTMFGLIEPNEINSDWVDVLVAHELTHLVFNSATENPYHGPPRWLNEGVAVYLSEGYTASWRSTVEAAVQNDRIIPLDGLAGLFPTTANEFRLAYGESVSAVNYLVETHGEEKLWSLVRSYANGVADDEAFSAAVGMDVAGFNAAWMESLGVDVPAPLGPQPGLPGATPPGWDVEAPPTPTAGAPTPAAPQPTRRPDDSPIPRQDGTEITFLAAGIIVVTLVALLVGLFLLRRNARRPPPPGSGWQPPDAWRPPDSGR